MIFGTNLKIYNAKNDLVDLDDLESIFSVSPEGFGAAIENNIFNAGASFKSSGVDMKASSLKLNLYFGLGDDKSEMVEYRKFVEFLNYPPYRLVYIAEETELFRDCILNEITKSDINTNQVLLEQVIFDFLTPFYKEISETYKPTSDTEGDGKIYAGANNQMNLIADPNFEDRSTLYWLYTGDEPGGLVRLPPKSNKPTSNIVQLISSGNREAGLMNSWGMTVKEGDCLSFRVDIRTEGNPDFTRPVIRLGDVANNRTYRYSDFGIISNSNDFKTAMISFVVDNDGDFTITLLNKNVSTLSEMSTYFREPMLIRGDISDMPVEQYDDSYPNLNLIDGTKDFSGTWSNSEGWATDGTYKGLTVLKRTAKWGGIYKTFTAPKDGVYTFSFYIKSSGDNMVLRWVNKNWVDISRNEFGSNFDWKRDSYTINLKSGDLFHVRYEFFSEEVNSEISVAGYKLEEAVTATPWMPSSSEVKPTDYPSYMPAFYEGKPSNNYYAYPFVYESDYNGKSGVFQIENNSVYIGSAKGSPVEITVHGPCTNPYWEILDGSKVLQSDGYNIDVPEGYRLVVSSVVQKQRVKLIAPDGTISDVYQQQDLSKSNFVTIPEGHATLAFHNVGDVSFNYREEYITV